MQRMLDFSKNGHAEVICKELEKLEPKFLAIFGIQELLECEASRSAAFFILKTYVERKSHVNPVEVTLRALLRDPIIEDQVKEYIR